jgi:hypothetical protein
MGRFSANKINNTELWKDEFSAYNPDPTWSAEEQVGAQGWKEAYQLDSDHYPLATTVEASFPYPEFIEKMLEAAWKPAAATKMKPQKQLIGQGRVFQPTATPAMKKAADYRAPNLHYADIPVSAAHLKGVAKDWSEFKRFKRLSGYAFRGDTRDPMTIKSQGGFKPPSTRTDDYYLDNAIIPNFKQYMKQRFGEDNLDGAALKTYIKGTGGKGMTFCHYECWRAMMQQEALHLGRMIASEFLKGFISTSRSTKISKSFAKASGWVYVLEVNGAFLLLGKSSDHHWQVFDEQELAVPDEVPWDSVEGFRQVGADLKFKGPIYLRNFGVDGEARLPEPLFELLSGKKQ